jgi:zinc transporter ZupT
MDRNSRAVTNHARPYHELLADTEIDPREYEEADFTKLVLILGILTVHSFPEGIAVGVLLVLPLAFV